MHDIGGGSWRSTNALASIDAEVEMLSGSYREVRRIKAISYLQVICGAERNDPKTAVLSDDQGKADLLRTSAQLTQAV
jgi:hypothetical protein